MIHEIEEEKKVDILLEALKERYESMHKIRDRVQSIGIWSLGIMVGICGWLLKGDISLNCFQKIIYTLAIAVAFYAIRFLYLKDLCKGFKSQQQVTAKLEKALGLFSEGFFINGEQMYPKGWEEAGKETTEGKFFKTTYILLYIGLVFVILSILFTTTPRNHFYKYNFHHNSDTYCLQNNHHFR